MNGRSMKGSSSRLRLVMLTVVGVVAAAAALPRTAEGAKSVCMDATWAEYNDCLVGSRWEAMKKLCDLQFFADAYACTREAIAE